MFNVWDADTSSASTTPVARARRFKRVPSVATVAAPVGEAASLPAKPPAAPARAPAPSKGMVLEWRKASMRATRMMPAWVPGVPLPHEVMALAPLLTELPTSEQLG